MGLEQRHDAHHSREAVTLAAVGATIGLAASALLGRVVASMLFGVTARDPLTYAAAALLVLVAAAAASLVAARRASRVEPLVALRSA